VRGGAGALVGVAGTFTTLVAHELGLRLYDPALVHGRTLTAAQIDAAIDLFRALTSVERGRLAGIQKGREDVILAGALIARAACRAFDAESAVVSEDDILEGIALWLADGLPRLT
jgi:exopolyphosphatase/guanosine-5'-triphosphate,3'-diphosphate pyrophosphatase